MKITVGIYFDGLIRELEAIPVENLKDFPSNKIFPIAVKITKILP